MRFLSNFGYKIIFMSSVKFWQQQDYNSLFKHWSRDLLVQVAYNLPLRRNELIKGIIYKIFDNNERRKICLQLVCVK